jgi:hypothetical protein
MPNQLRSNRLGHRRKQGTLLIAGFSALCALVVLVLQIVGGENSSVSLAVLTILISGFVAVWRARRYGLDPLALFSAAFLMYDGVLLLRLSLVSNSSVLVYPTSFGDNTFAAAGGLCALAATAMLFTTLAWEGVVGGSGRSTFVKPSEASALSWFWVGLFGYFIGLALYYMQFQQFGGYLASLAMQRVSRFEFAGESNMLSYPYMAFVVPGIACMCYGSQTSAKTFRRAAFYVFTAVWCLLALLQGDRRLVLQAVLTVAGVMAVVRPQAVRLKTQTWILIAAMYCFFAVFGYARNSISSVATGKATTSQAFSEVNDQMSSDWLTPEHSEFAGPYLSLLEAVSVHSKSLYGTTYFESFPTVLPRFMYPGQKPELLSQEFAEQMHRGSGSTAGWGYNPVAEAYVNFGVVGIVLIFVLWTVYFVVMRSIRFWGDWGILLSASLLSEAVNANRIDFRNVYWETAYFMVAVAAASVVKIIIDKLWTRPSVRHSLHTPPMAPAR